MIRLPKNFFENLSPMQYREYLELLPKLNNEKVKSYLMLAFTLAALSFFGIFAIKPTLSTIIELKRKLADLQFVNQKYTEKLENLNKLYGDYNSLLKDLSIIIDALPQKPEAPKLMAQINALSNKSDLRITSLNILSADITPERQPSNTNASSIDFTLEATGTYKNIFDFIKSVIHIDRLITIEAVSISKDVNGSALVLNLQGRGYFKQ